MSQKKSKLDELITNSPFKKKWIANELGITPTAFSTILKRPEMLEKDKLKLEKLCQILDVNTSDIL